MESNLLVVLVDCSAAWAAGGDAAAGAAEFGATVEAVAVMLRAFLTLRQSNRVAVHGVGAGRSKLLVGESLDETRRLQGAHVVHQVVTALHQFCAEESATDSAGQAELARGLAAALCYAHHVRASRPALRSRVLIVQRSHDCTHKYVQTMNCIFAAQHDTVVLDALVLRAHDSTYLQQASSLTNGAYHRTDPPQGAAALLPVLMGGFLPDPPLRTKLPAVTDPTPAGVDARAACFCHKRPLDVGHVCSVCLSIYCAFVPVCTMCGSKFSFPGLSKVDP